MNTILKSGEEQQRETASNQVRREEAVITETAEKTEKTGGVHSAESGESIRVWVRSLLRGSGRENLFERCMDHVGSLLVAEALCLTRGNRTRAARLLGMSRPTFHKKMEKYNLKIDINVR